jgi:hypothetical protein
MYSHFGSDGSFKGVILLWVGAGTWFKNGIHISNLLPFSIHLIRLLIKG